MRSIASLLPLASLVIVLMIVLLFAAFSSLRHHGNVHKTSASSGRHRNVLETLLSSGHPGNVLETPASSGRHGNCSAVFEQGFAWVQWRDHGPDIEPFPGAPVCVIQKFSEERVKECMERRFRFRRRPFEAYFIGDSQIRELFAFSGPRLGADHEIKSGKDNCLDRINRTYEPGEKPHGRDHWCSFARWGRLVNATYLLRHHLNKQYMDTMHSLITRCKGGQCPDLVIVNGGLHEMWRNYGQHWAVGVQQFGSQMTQLTPMLVRLAHHGVIVIWAMIEPPMEDAGGGFVRMTPELAWLMNLVVMTELRKVPGVHLWSSHIPVALWYQNLCRALDYPKEFGFKCGDPLHAGAIALENYFEILMNYVCDEHVEMPDSQCCGLKPRTDL